ncbi:hypothetical protein PORCRE_1336 [Porphyromonas crevioricanis JCM 15906]|uniref:Uncharacterized protein n=1 Tax=Porphyromonas crevioricanis JCM 15906 TaxID=1305617 RepID=T1CHY8_9PORP|nr:hypothetical protein PORCRE_1336 [Porphyromonas crevioricanis JCM 15906]GAD06517.1 hypothetical protein PORCAN_113 [Porphyromonas crevioricanis JCM 13913]
MFVLTQPHICIAEVQLFFNTLEKRRNWAGMFIFAPCTPEGYL